MNTFTNTPLQRGGYRHSGSRNRFNGFGEAWQTAEAVDHAPGSPPTPLKRGVNESLTQAPGEPLRVLLPLTPAVSLRERVGVRGEHLRIGSHFETAS